MKTNVLLLTALSLGFSALSAQSVPEFLNYQGTVTDSAGVGLGDSAPVNRKVLFRVYDAATAGSLIWTEEQTVTISKGEFSVLLGQGIAFSSEAHDSLLTVFGEGATDRYLAITVDNGDGTLNGSDLPIAPRQRITSTAYSFRAGTADSIASGSSLKLNTADSGLGYYDAGRTFGGFNISGPVLYGAGGGALGVDNGAGTQTTALRWTSAGNVGLGTTTPNASSKLHVVGNSFFDGNVGIGTTTPGFPLTFSDALGDKISLNGQSGNSYGFGIQSSRLQIHTDGVGSDILFGYGSSAALTETMRIKGNGNVGIGTTTPNAKLEVAGDIRVKSGGLSLYNSWGSVVRPMQTGLLSNEIHGSRESGSDEGLLRLIAGGGSFVSNKTAIDLYGTGINDMRFFTNGTERMRVAHGGKVGVRTANPAANLHVTGVETPQMTLGSPTGVTFAVGNALGQYGLNFGVRGDGISWIQGGRTDGSDTAYNISLQASGGNVGIGTSAPAYKLDVNGTVRVTGDVRTTLDFKPSGTSYRGMEWVNDSGSRQARIFRYGEFDNRLYFSNNGQNDLVGVYLASGGTSFASTSDERLKSNIEPLTGILDKISDIRVVGYNMASASVDTETGKMKVDRTPHQRTTRKGKAIKQEIGTIAQDWVESFPELVVEPHNEDGFYGLNYDRIGVVALGAAKELNSLVVKQQAEIADLTAQVARLEAKDAARETRLAAIEQLLSTK